MASQLIASISERNISKLSSYVNTIYATLPCSRKSFDAANEKKKTSIGANYVKIIHGFN